MAQRRAIPVTGGRASERLDARPALLKVETRTRRHQECAILRLWSVLERALRRRGLSAASTGLARCSRVAIKGMLAAYLMIGCVWVRDELDVERMAEQWHCMSPVMPPSLMISG